MNLFSIQSPLLSFSSPRQPMRERRCVLWLTGLSGAGKSTIAIALERTLCASGWRTSHLDGDDLRQGLSSDLGFSPRDRVENIRRAGHMAKLLADSGTICIATFISPYREDREMVRRLMPAGGFIEVFVNAPLAVCEKRDVKGLYAKARANLIPEFTGISAPYEPPLTPEIEIKTAELTLEESVDRILNYLERTPSNLIDTVIPLLARPIENAQRIARAS